MWLYLYGREAVQHMLQNGLKTQKMQFLPVLEHMLDRLMAIKVEPHQCSSHHSILLAQGPIHEIFGRVEKLSFFESAILIFFSKKNFFASSPWKLVTNYVLEWMGLKFYDYDGLQPKTTPPKHFSRQCIPCLVIWNRYKTVQDIKKDVLRRKSTPKKFTPFFINKILKTCVFSVLLDESVSICRCITYIFLTRVNEFFKSFSLNIYLASLYYMITTPLILMKIS